MFESIEKIMDELKEDGKNINRIILHDKLVNPGWFFVINNGGDYSLVANKKDVEACLFPTKLEDGMERYPRIFDLIMYTNNDDAVYKVMKGVFEYCRMVKRPSAPF